ncbi:DMT family transporter [Bordetella sp. 02P26C-1]|uniref:DMT family transporter n=1 Tax=Bordetella sp. 02P26C-1 TaxID=2683195 RepID=UPI001352266C|nr:DMT family transporter [Bordetella sp. 02P26C-1]MVW79415.1 EamA family transporter [Bordetella sp. 02P26C-1]
MRRRDLLDLITLAALFGASFLFMRVAVPEFGPGPLAALRVSFGALTLLPIALMRGRLPVIARHWRAILGVGALNSAIPFILYTYAAQSLGAGFLSVANAVTPVWGAVIGWIWFKDRLPMSRTIGLGIAVVGIVVLVWDKLDFRGGDAGGTAILAAIGAPLCYGIAANWTKRFLSHVDALSSATGSMLAAALILSPFAVLHWPQTPVSGLAWLATLALAVGSTGFAYILFFRLISRIGPTAAVSVTLLVPVFGVLWGVWLLNESVTPSILAGACVIMLGTALALGLIGGAKREAKPNTTTRSE